VSDVRTPIFYVQRVDKGKTARLDLTNRVTAFEYTDSERKPDMLRLTVDNHDLSNWDDPVWERGTILEIRWGYPDRLTPARRVVIKSVKGFTQLEIEARGLEVVAGAEHKSRVFRNMTRAQVVDQLAREIGFDRDQDLHIENTEKVYEEIVQARLTDAQFISRLAHRQGFVWYVDIDGFHWHRRDLNQKPNRVFTWYNVPRGLPGEILNLRIENDVTRKPGRVKSRGYNPDEKAPVGGEATDGTDPEQKTLSQGLALIDAKTLEFNRVRASGVGTDGEVKTRLCTEETNEGCQEDAQASHRRFQEVAVKLVGDVVGDPLLLAKTVFELQNAGKRISQRYYISELVHRLDSGTVFVCSLRAVSDGWGGRNTNSKVAQGLVLLEPLQKKEGKKNTEPTDEEKAAQASLPDRGAPLDAVAKVNADTLEFDTVWVDGQGRRDPTANQSVPQPLASLPEDVGNS